MSTIIAQLSFLSLVLISFFLHPTSGDDLEHSVATISEIHKSVERRPAYLRSTGRHEKVSSDGDFHSVSTHSLDIDGGEDGFSGSSLKAQSPEELEFLPETLSPLTMIDDYVHMDADPTVSKPDFTKKLPHWWKQAAAAVLIVVGLVEVFLGYRFFTVTMFTYGFFVVAAPVWFTFWFYVDLGSLSEVMRHCVCIGVAAFGGVLGGTLLVCVSVIAIFMLGAGLGVVIAFILNAAVYSHFNLAPNMANVPLIGSAVGLGIICGVVALCVRKVFIVLATSVIGAFAVVYGASLYHKDFDFISMARDIAEGDRTYPSFVYGYVAGFLFLAVLGIIIQFTVTAKGMKSKGRQVDDAYSELEVALTRIMGKHSKSKKKSKKKKKRSKRSKAAALLADYEPGGAYYDYYYDDQTDYGYDDYDDSRSYYDGYGYDRASTYSRPMSAAASRRSSMYRDDDGMTAYSMRSGRKKSYTGGLL